MVGVGGGAGHIHLLYDYTVTLFIVYEKQVLLVKNARDGKWQPIAGHIELDEDPEGAALRLMDMEVGGEAELFGSKPEFESSGSRAVIAPSYISVDEVELPHQHVSLIYFASAHTKDVSLFEDYNDFKWLGEAELGDSEYGLSKSQIFYAQQALRQISKEVVKYG